MGMLFFVIILVVIGVGLYLYFSRRNGNLPKPFSQKDDPLEAARKRYAEGEISREEFEQIKSDLENR